MPDLVMEVDVALGEVPVNLLPLLDDTDFKTRETAVAYNAAGMDLVWNFVTPDGAFTQTAVTPTTAGTYDWTHQGDGMYTIEIPASAGVSINNNAVGIGWFTGFATGVLPWRGPTIQVSPANVVNALVNGTDRLQVHADEITAGLITAAALAADAITDAKVASDVTIASVTGSVGSVTAGVTVTTNNDKTGYGLSAAAVQAIWDALTSALTTVGSIGKRIVDNLDTAVSSRATTTSGGSIVTGVDNKVLISTTAGAFPSQAIQAIFDALTSALTTVGSIGKLLVDNVNATISSRATPAQVATELATYDGPTNAEMVARTLAAADYATAALIDALPTAAENADGVWDEAMSGHTTAGTFGDKFRAHAAAVLKALVTTGSSTTAVVLNATTGIEGGAPSSTDDFYNGRVIIFITGALAGQATDITDYTGSSKTLTVTALTGAPSSGDTAVIV